MPGTMSCFCPCPYPFSDFSGKDAVAFISGVCLQLFVLLPACVVYGWMIGFSLAGAVSMAVVFLLLPLISMTINAFLGWILAMISEKLPFKHLFTLLLYVGFFGLYFLRIQQDNLLHAVDDGKRKFHSKYGEADALSPLPYGHGGGRREFYKSDSLCSLRAGAFWNFDGDFIQKLLLPDG